MLGDSAEGGTVQRWLCARREGSRALPRAKPRTGALFAAAQGGYAARGGGAGVASHPESTSGAGGGGGGTLDGGATGFAICAATGAATGWCSAGTCGADTAALGAGSATGASSSGQSQRSSRSSLPTATGVPGKASGTSSRFSAARPVESRAPAAFSVPSSCSLLARVETSVERSLDRDTLPKARSRSRRRARRDPRRAAPARGLTVQQRVLADGEGESGCHHRGSSLQRAAARRGWTDSPRAPGHRPHVPRLRELTAEARSCALTRMQPHGVLEHPCARVLLRDEKPALRPEVARHGHHSRFEFGRTRQHFDH